MNKIETIIIGADHRGYRLKEAVRTILEELNLNVADVGTNSEEPSDYPDYAAAVARSVSQGEFKRGILVCGSGAGMVITANKFRGIRATLCLNKKMAYLSRRHNDANILVLSGMWTTPKKASEIVRIWLETPFEGGRHARRIEKITLIEKANGL
ncbi:MAG: ribose 5-phosphate isomerase B [Syntrophales bacterium]|nr:ribose 5-phosphate isomerase B [Syntrophales bacterium]